MSPKRDQRGTRLVFPEFHARRWRRRSRSSASSHARIHVLLDSADRLTPCARSSTARSRPKHAKAAAQGAPGSSRRSPTHSVEYRICGCAFDSVYRYAYCLCDCSGRVWSRLTVPRRSCFQSVPGVNGAWLRALSGNFVERPGISRRFPLNFEVFRAVRREFRAFESQQRCCCGLLPTPSAP